MFVECGLKMTNFCVRNPTFHEKFQEKLNFYNLLKNVKIFWWLRVAN